MPDKNWWQTAFDQKYEITHGVRETTTLEFAFLQSVLQKRTKILDLACGEGRLSIPLAQKGYEVVGLDYSEYQISRAREALKATGRNHEVAFIQGDMRDIPYENEFDAVINMFTSFGYFHDESDHLKTLQQVHKALKPNGIFVLDLIGKECRIRDIQEGAEITVVTEHGHEIKHSNTFEEQSQHWQGSWGWEGGAYTSSVRLFNEKEIRALMSEAQLTIKNIWGSYKMDAFDEQNSRRMIILAEK